jgi:pyridoxal 5'-phosphate synthase pdxS subunit
MADMLKGGVIMDVVTPDQAKIAEDAGAVAVMALERVPADIRAQGGVARMSDPDMIDGIIAAVSIQSWPMPDQAHLPRPRCCRRSVDYIDESEVLSPADEAHHVDKWNFTVPVRVRRDQPALRRIAEGAAMIRSKGEAGTGNVVRDHPAHARHQGRDAAAVHAVRRGCSAAKELRAPVRVVAEVASAGKLPVVLFTAAAWPPRRR